MPLGSPIEREREREERPKELEDVHGGEVTMSRLKERRRESLWLVQEMVGMVGLDCLGLNPALSVLSTIILLSVSTCSLKIEQQRKFFSTCKCERISLMFSREIEKALFEKTQQSNKR